jgi:hypothetical protein
MSRAGCQELRAQSSSQKEPRLRQITGVFDVVFVMALARSFDESAISIACLVCINMGKRLAYNDIEHMPLNY